MKWVTWEQVGVDRMACAWLITKYIDRDAEFLFVPAGQKPLPEGAEPFDIPSRLISPVCGCPITGDTALFTPCCASMTCMIPSLSVSLAWWMRLIPYRT